MPDPGFIDGRQTVGSNARVTAGAQTLAASLWSGGSDEQYHFLLYLCGHVVEIVQAVTDRFDLEATIAAAAARGERRP